MHLASPTNVSLAGRGSRIAVENEKGEKASLPRAVFEVFGGSRFRFRAIFNGLQNCPVQVGKIIAIF